MILIVGATGRLGRLIAQRLMERGEHIRVLMRDGPSSEALAKAGAEIATGDLKDPDSLVRACRGADAVVTTANAVARGGEDTIDTVDRQGNRDLIDAAEEQGVRRFVFVSALGADSESPMPLLRAKAETERRLREGGMRWSVLQPDLYMDILLPIVIGGPAVSGQAVSLIGEGRRIHSQVAMDDVAAYAIAALDRTEAEGRTLLIGGAHPFSWRDAVVAFERELGREVPVRFVERGDPLPGMPDFVPELLAALETYDSPLEMSGLYHEYGVRPTSLADFVHGLVTSTSTAS